MGGVREELEPIRRGFEPGGGIVAEYGSEVLEDLELEDPKVGIVRAELLVKVGPGDNLGRAMRHERIERQVSQV